MNWGIEDFVAAGLMLALVAGAFLLARRSSNGPTYLAAFALAVGSAFVVVWVSLAVGIIGEQDNPANLFYAAVIGVGIGAAMTARLRPKGMAIAMAAATLVQVCASLAAYFLAGADLMVLVFNAALTGSLALSAFLFLIAAGRKSAPEMASPFDAGPRPY